MTTVFAFLALGVGLLVRGLTSARSRAGATAFTASTGYLYLVFFLLTVGLCTAGYLSYRDYGRHHRAEVEEQLSAVARLKVAELAAWRAARQGDAEVLFENEALRSLVDRFLAAPEDEEARALLQTWLDSYPRHYPYVRVALLDGDGSARLTAPRDAWRRGERLAREAEQVMASGRTTFVDFYLDEELDAVRLALLVPVLAPDSGPPIAVLALCIDPHAFLYPFIQRWPASSETAETLLIRRDGHDVLFLNQLRFDPDAALSLRIPLERTDVPAVMGILGGHGIVQGRDYRGVRVIAAVEPVADSPWFLVARVDQDEVYAAEATRLWQISSLVLVLLLAAGSVLALVWRHRLNEYLQRQLLADDRIRAAHGRLDALVEATPDAVFLKDLEGRYTLFNSGAAAVTDVPAEQILGRDDRSLFPPAEAAALMEGDRRVMESGEVQTFEEQLTAAGGSLRTFLTTRGPLLDAAGKVSGLFGIARDITERKELEAERAALEATLRHQQKLESIGTLASGVAHEINNPINGVMNYAQLIIDDTSGEGPVADCAREILLETERVAGIVRSLLQFARLESQQHQPANIREIVEQTLSLIRTVIRHDQITLQVELPPDLPAVSCRSQQIQQVLMNLLTNARDALNARHPAFDSAKVLRISAEPFERSDRRWLRVTVRDGGIGITDEDLERIFDPFFTTKGRDQGTGLGLAISHGIAREHHGDLRVEVSPTDGTAFHLELPVDGGGRGPDETQP